MKTAGGQLWFAILASVACLSLVKPALAGSRLMNLPVPAATVYPGDRLTVETLRTARMIVPDGARRSYAMHARQVTGKVARHTLPAGRAIPLSAVREAYAFKTGERVSMVLAVGGLRITAVGVALGPGIVGKSARVRNIDSGSIIHGVVRPSGVVEVGIRK
ncbi:MAG: flagellar basal body P-ring formation chaperone FlgA [Pseudomonadota bacterium]